MRLINICMFVVCMLRSFLSALLLTGSCLNSSHHIKMYEIHEYVCECLVVLSADVSSLSLATLVYTKK